MKASKDKVSIKDFDSVAEYIEASMDAGYTIEPEDFEGYTCAYCGETVWFHDIVNRDIKPEDLPLYGWRDIVSVRRSVNVKHTMTRGGCAETRNTRSMSNSRRKIGENRCTVIVTESQINCLRYRWDGTVVVACSEGCIEMKLSMMNAEKRQSEYVDGTKWENCPKCGAETGTLQGTPNGSPQIALTLTLARPDWHPRFDSLIEGSRIPS